MIAVLFSALALTSITAAYFLKFRLSGEDLNALKLYTCLIFNGLFAVPYLDIAKNDNFLFLGHQPEIINTYPSIGWIALFSAVAHALALPTK